MSHIRHTSIIRNAGQLSCADVPPKQHLKHFTESQSGIPDGLVRVQIERQSLP